MKTLGAPATVMSFYHPRYLFDKELVSTQVGLRQDGRKPLLPRESNTDFPLRSLVTFKGKVAPWPTMKEYAGVDVLVLKFGTSLGVSRLFLPPPLPPGRH